jgi:cytochrome d ubiquinol oxidase subunit I
VAIGANLSALWILGANAWMQNPVGMVFNPETARNEMVSFWEVLFNEVAVTKFLHTISSGFLLGSMFVVGISAYYLLKNREILLAKRSILVAGIFGLLSSLLVVYTGDTSARALAKAQPVKFAAFEALYEGTERAGLVAVGLLKESDKKIGDKKVNDFVFRIEIPGFLSVMTGGSAETCVPGIYDLVNGNPERGLLSVSENMERGNKDRDLLIEYKEARKNNDTRKAESIAAQFSDREFNESISDTSDTLR